MPIPATVRSARPALGALLLLALAACDLPPRGPQRATGITPRDVPVVARSAGAVEETVAAPATEVVTRINAALRQRGIVPLGPVVAELPIEARGQLGSPPGWAACPEVSLRDPFAEAFRARTASAGEIRSSMTVTVRGIDGDQSRVAVRAVHQGTYINSFTNNPEQRPCRSTGVLEQEILAAARGG